MPDTDRDEPPELPVAAKRRLRAELSARRSAMDDDLRTAARAAIARLVAERCAAERWTCVAAYVALRTEPGSPGLLTALTARGVRVLVPLTLPDRDLDWVSWSPSGVGSALGRLAIGSADAVLVPALAVAADGTRLGRGGGSYDRALSRCAPGTPVAALLYDGELVAQLPREPWDRPVSHAVLPSGWRAL